VKLGSASSGGLGENLFCFQKLDASREFPRATFGSRGIGPQLPRCIYASKYNDRQRNQFNPAENQAYCPESGLEKL
jgi:hypothetical protein